MTSDARLWLLLSDVPTGPFTVAEVFAKLATGEATWQTPACPVGSGTWLPIARTPGLGPTAGSPAESGSRSPPAAPPVAPTGERTHPANDRGSDARDVPDRTPTSAPGGSRAMRAWAAIGGALPVLVVGAIVWRANCTGEDGRDKVGDPRPVPAEYRPYLRDGKVVPTGNPTIDYWVYVNVFLDTVSGRPSTGEAARREALTRPTVLRSLAKVFRERPTAGVDPELVRWVGAVAAHLDTRADLLERANDPATLQQAREEVAAGRPNPLDAIERAVGEWERERERLLAEGRSLQETLSRWHGRSFPPPTL